MRISELLALDAVTEEGKHLGHVTDIRFTAHDDDPSHFVADGLVVGTLGVAERFGYRRGVVEGPWIAARILRWLRRNGAFVPWEDVRGFGDGQVIVARPDTSDR